MNWKGIADAGLLVSLVCIGALAFPNHMHLAIASILVSYFSLVIALICNVPRHNKED